MSINLLVMISYVTTLLCVQVTALTLQPDLHVAAAGKAQGKPHILFILLDDLGWSDVGFNNEASIETIPTPNIDWLAYNGVILKRHYVHKFCSPTRSAIQSGRAPIHVNVNNALTLSRNMADPLGGFAGVPRNMTGIASVLKSVGYMTHMVGKWDVGVATPDHLPAGRGYDSSLIYFEHTNDCWTFASELDCGHVIDLWEHDESITFPGRPATGLVNQDGCTFENQDGGCVYEDQLFENRVKEIITKHESAKPLFLLWATHAVHGPYQPPTKYVDQAETFAQHSGHSDWFGSKTTYLGTLAFIDESIGRVIDLVKEKGMYNNMLIVFSSDNGAVPGMSNEPLRGAKFTNWEGGIRAVSCISGGFLPKNVRGSTTHGLVAVQDWYSTFAYLAGADPFDYRANFANLPAVDSINVWPLLSGETDISPRNRIEIGTNSGGFATEARKSGKPTMGGMIKRVGGKLYKLLLGDFEGEAECDMMFGPAYTRERPEGSDWDTECIKVTRVCGTTPEHGCLFDLDTDPAEMNSLALQESEVFLKLLEECNKELETVYAPDRGTAMDEDCISLKNLSNAYLGPFVAI